MNSTSSSPWMCSATIAETRRPKPEFGACSKQATTRRNMHQLVTDSCYTIEKSTINLASISSLPCPRSCDLYKRIAVSGASSNGFRIDDSPVLKKPGKRLSSDCESSVAKNRFVRTSEWFEYVSIEADRLIIEKPSEVCRGFD